MGGNIGDIGGNMGNNTRGQTVGKFSPTAVSTSPSPDQLATEFFGDLDTVVNRGQMVVGWVKGWRLERKSNGYWRWRWSMKDDHGQPITYTTARGRVGYKRGSKYVGKISGKRK